jgi:hypothetical protein
VLGGRDPGCLGNLLHPRLRAFEPRGGDVGTEREAPAPAHGLRGARDNRAFRPHDHHVDVEVVGEVRDGIGIVCVDRHAAGGRGDARIPRRGDDFRCARGSQEAPDERVLAPAGPDDEELHAAFGNTTVCARSGPTATNDTGTPASDSMNFT